MVGPELKWIHHVSITIVPVTSQNAYFANHENLLIEKLADVVEYRRTLVMKRIVNASSSVGSNSAIRQFVIPDLNFEDENYIDLKVSKTVN